MTDSSQPPLSDSAEAIYRRARLRWQLAQLTPLAYLLIAQLARHQGWLGEEESTPPLWGETTENVIVALCGAGLLGWAGWMRWRQARVGERFTDTLAALKRWSYEFYMLITLADTAAFAALFYFFVTGHFGVLLAGGILAYIIYALVHPRRSDLEGLDMRRRMSE